MKRVVWLLCALSCVCADSVRYTIESYTEDGKSCMSDCIFRKCKADTSANRKDCWPGKVAGYQYYTALKESDKPLCLSRCSSFGENYDWCYVSDDLAWDYCSSNIRREVVKHEFTDSKGPCRSACARRGEDYFWCDTFWDSPKWDYCKPDIYYEYVQSYTRKGVKCIGICKKHDGESYNWCRTATGWDYCAEPARSIFGKNCHGQCSSRSKRSDDVDDLNRDCVRRPNLVRDMATAYEGRSELTTRQVNDPRNPVTSYTIGRGNTTDEPDLPFVVRARIMPAHLPPPNTRTSDAIPSRVRSNLRRMGRGRSDAENNNDEAGHLIAFQNGGPAEPYNFAPQTRRLNRGTNDGYVQAPSIWYTDEFAINNWVRTSGGSVEETVVVLYDDPDRIFRPAGFGTSMRFLNPDGTLARTCPDYFFSNDPSFY